jgi:cell division septum initiation protein DivIVA
MAPDSIDADPASLPRSFRGYDPQATEELFRRVAWEYAVLAGEHQELKNTLEDLQAAPGSPPRAETPARARDDDEVARFFVGAARRAAREMRESARAECESVLKKAKARAAEIEEEAARAAADSASVIEAAVALRSTLHEALKQLERGEPVVRDLAEA